MKYQRFIKSIATLGPIGYNFASGTLGSFVALIAVYFLHKNIPDTCLQIFLIINFAFFSLYVISKSRRLFNSSDPKEIILDEFIGCFFVFFGLPFNLFVCSLGFVLFRFFDITKIFGISYLEKNIPGSLGILTDDLIAGLLANFVIRIIIS